MRPIRLIVDKMNLFQTIKIVDDDEKMGDNITSSPLETDDSSIDRSARLDQSTDTFESSSPSSLSSVSQQQTQINVDNNKTLRAEDDSTTTTTTTTAKRNLYSRQSSGSSLQESKEEPEKLHEKPDSESLLDSNRAAAAAEVAERLRSDKKLKLQVEADSLTSLAAHVDKGRLTTFGSLPVSQRVSMSSSTSSHRIRLC